MRDPPSRIRVVNPNSNEEVTRGLDAALEPLRFANGPEIVCSTLAEGPFGIETQADVESVVMPLRRMVETDNSSDAFVIACYSDPGLHVCREGTTRPVFGIAECGVLTALARAGRFGVIAISQRSIARHRRYLLQMGLTDRFAGERRTHAAAHDRRRAPAEGTGRRGNGDHGLCGNGAPPSPAGRGARHPGDRPDAGRGDHGVRSATVQPRLTPRAASHSVSVCRITLQRPGAEAYPEPTAQ